MTGGGDSSRWENSNNPLKFAANFRFAGQAVLNTAFYFKFCRSEIYVRIVGTSVGLDAILQHFVTDNFLLQSLVNSDNDSDSEQYLVKELWSGVYHSHDSSELDRSECVRDQYISFRVLQLPGQLTD
jgi:hypothetical protein